MLQSFLEQSAHEHPEKVALVVDQNRSTYLELDQQSNRLANALVQRGVERGDRVAIHLDNALESVVSIFAVLKAGGVFVMVNPTTKIDKLIYVLNNCRASALIIPEKKTKHHFRTFRSIASFTDSSHCRPRYPTTGRQ